MVLSQTEKAMAEAAYARQKSGHGYRAGIVGAFMGVGIGFSSSFFRLINDPHTSRHAVIFYSALLGLTFGACFVSGLFLTQQRKQDAALVRLFENNFPGECSWKQEEKILAAAENLRLKAKTDELIRKSA